MNPTRSSHCDRDFTVLDSTHHGLPLHGRGRLCPCLHLLHRVNAQFGRVACHIYASCSMYATHGWFTMQLCHTAAPAWNGRWGPILILCQVLDVLQAGNCSQPWVMSPRPNTLYSPLITATGQMVKFTIHQGEGEPLHPYYLRVVWLLTTWEQLRGKLPETETEKLYILGTDVGPAGSCTGCLLLLRRGLTVPRYAPTQASAISNGL